MTCMEVNEDHKDREHEQMSTCKWRRGNFLIKTQINKEYTGGCWRLKKKDTLPIVWLNSFPEIRIKKKHSESHLNIKATTNLYTFSEILKRKSQGTRRATLYLDFQRPFDKASHERLLHKLKSITLGDNLRARIRMLLKARVREEAATLRFNTKPCHTIFGVGTRHWVGVKRYNQNNHGATAT